jgi:hypothetical protein
VAIIKGGAFGSLIDVGSNTKAGRIEIKLDTFAKGVGRILKTFEPGV